MEIQRLRISSCNDVFFNDAWSLYEDTFPENERRPFKAQLDIMSKENYYFEILFSDDNFIGILLWWDLGSYRYLEHFCFYPKYRGLGFGSLLMSEFINEKYKMLILEVEKPLDFISEKRILFYEKLGFCLNDYDYFQAVYDSSCPSVGLLLMSYPNSISGSLYNSFILEGHAMITNN